MTSRDQKYARVTELFQTLHRIRFSDILDCKDDENSMSMPEFAIALCIDMMKNEGSEHVLVADLVKKLPSSPQAISKYLKRLEERGMLMRLSVKKDRRSTEILLTEKGQQALKCSRERMNKFYREVFGGISEEEFNSMISFLKKICDAMLKKSMVTN